MKKNLLFIALAFCCINSYAQNITSYYANYPITVTQTYNGNTTRFELSVYDSLLGSWQYFNTPYLDDISQVHCMTNAGIAAYYGNYQSNYYSKAGLVTYDFEINQWKQLLDSGEFSAHSSVAGNGFAELFKELDYGGNSYSVDGYYYYDIKAHNWAGVTGGGGYGASAGMVNNDGIGWGWEGDFDEEFDIDHYNPVTHSSSNIVWYNYWGFPFIADDEMVLISYFELGTSFYYAIIAYDATTATAMPISFPNSTRGITKDGIFYVNDTVTNKIYFGAYDVQQHQWKLDSVNAAYIDTGIVSNRVIAMADYTPSANKVICSVYSFNNHQLITDTVASSGITGLTVSNGTVTWYDSGSNLHTRGYVDSTGWGNYITPPQSIFYLQSWNTASTGSIIYIKDYSIGAYGVSYDYGDGYTSSVDNPFHLYKISGHYRMESSSVQNFTVCQTAYGAGTDNSCDTTSFACIPPSANITASGSATFCPGDSVVLSAPVQSNCTYQWKKGNINIPGATSHSYTATVTGTYKVMVSDTAGGCSQTTNPGITVTVNSLPSAVITANGPTIFCAGSSVLLSAPGGANKTYQWKKGGVDISGATSSSYSATLGGNYKVTVTNTNTGCSKTSDNPTVVTVKPAPNAIITTYGRTRFCAGASVLLEGNTGTGLTYKWKKGGNYISGATLSTYTATTGGVYKVEVTKSNGCSTTSAGVTVTVPCKEGDELNSENVFDVKVYPNPSAGVFTIKFSSKPISPIQIEMIDALGKVVERFETIEETVVIDKSNLANGIYCLTARNNYQVSVRKINIER
jgi:hypothetical protein